MAVTVKTRQKQAMNMEDTEVHDDIFVREGAALVPYRPHDMFVTPETQLENIRRWNEGFGDGFRNDEIDHAAIQLERLSWPRGHLSALVLVPYRRTVQQTFDVLWAEAAAAQPSSLVLSGIKSDPRHLWLAQGIKHVPGLRWETINLGAYWGSEDITPAEIRDTNSAHAGVLAAAAHFPLWVQAMAGKEVPEVWIPGYHVRTPALDDNPRTLHLGWTPPSDACTWISIDAKNQNRGGITLDASMSDARPCPHAGPTIKLPPKPLALTAGTREHLALPA